MEHHPSLMQTNRVLAIGDVHGCLNQLKTLLARVEPSPSDQIIFLGDYVDRGPDSAGVITFLLDFATKFPETVFLRGNHEQMFLDYLRGEDPALFLLNGGEQTLRSYRERGMWPLPSPHYNFLASLSHYFESEHHIFVHAGLRPGTPLAGQSDLDLLWIRGEFLHSDYNWGKTIVFGHTPLQEPLIQTNRMGLDTGCVYGRRLTCCDVRSGNYWQVQGWGDSL